MEILFLFVPSLSLSCSEDSAYTERYMGLPISIGKRNISTIDHYFTSDLMNKAALLKKKKFLLIHGTADGKQNVVSIGHSNVDVDENSKRE